MQGEDSYKGKIYIYIYIYINRERAREKESREKEREGASIERREKESEREREEKKKSTYRAMAHKSGGNSPQRCLPKLPWATWVGGPRQRRRKLPHKA